MTKVFPTSRLLYPLGITGSPRSGTHYARKCFWDAGIRLAAEEGIERDGVCSWKLAGKNCRSRFRVIFHQVRHPLKTIGSLQTMSDGEWECMEEYLAEVNLLKISNVVRRAMLFWLEWNRLAESIADYRYRVEDFAEEWLPLLAKAGFMLRPLPEVSKRFNSRRKRYTPLSWDDLRAADKSLEDSIRYVSWKLGYKE